MGLVATAKWLLELRQLAGPLLFSQEIGNGSHLLSVLTLLDGLSRYILSSKENSIFRDDIKMRSCQRTGLSER